MSSVRLADFNNSWYSPGRSFAVQSLWFFLGLPLLRASWNPFSAFRCWLLRRFGASVGTGVVIKPGVRVKYPWLLEIGDHSWIGEDAWIDNLSPVRIGADVCISQGVYLCTGNHDWSDPAFGLIARPIQIADGAWIGAKVIVCPGITVAEGAVATAGSVVTRDLDAHTIYGGNPAVKIKSRHIRTKTPAVVPTAGGSSSI